MSVQRFGRHRFAVWVACVAVLLPALPGHRAAAAEDGFAFAQRFTPVTEGPGYLPQASPYAYYINRLVTLEDQRVFLTMDKFSPTFVAPYDLDTLEPLGDGMLLQGTLNAVTHVDAHDWIVAAEGTFTVTSGLEVLAYDGALRRVGTFTPAAGFGSPQHKVIGMASVPGTALMFVIATELDPALGGVPVSGTTTLSLVDLEGVQEGGGRLLWTQNLPQCDSPVFDPTNRIEAALGYVAEQQAVYFGCSPNKAPFSDQALGAQPPGFGGVGRLRVTTTDGIPDQPVGFTLFPRDGDFRNAIATFDPVTERLALSPGSSSTGWSVYVFDTHDEAWVGAFSVGGNLVTQMGTAYGRLFVSGTDITAGLIATDLATTPLEQGRRDPSYREHHPDDPETPGITQQAMPLLIDGPTQRLFLPPYTIAATDDTPPTNTEYFFVIKDKRPPYVEPPAQDPDAITTDIPEVPGRTGRTIAASAQGFGTRTRQVGGPNALLLNLSGFEGVGAGADGETRQFMNAFVDHLVLTGNEANAAAIAAQRDAVTEDEQATTGTEWPYTTAECSDFGGSPGNDDQEGARVECDVDKLLAAASAVGDAAQSGDVTSSHASVEAELGVDDEDGTVATVTAAADGINFLAGAMTMGRVEARTKVTAHGRPGTATGSYERSVRDVTVGGQVICGDSCDLEEVAQAFNEYFVGRARIDFPSPDQELKAGSPGGAVAIVQDTEAYHVQAVALNQQDPTRREVPAMVITMYQDNRKPARTVYEFAGVQAEARYGIYPIEGGGPGENDGGATGSATGGSDTGGTGSSSTGAQGDQAPSFESPGPPIDSGSGQGDPPDVAPPDPGAAPPIAVPTPGLVETIRVLVANEPLRAAGLFLVWFLLLLPIYLAARRSLFLHRQTLATTPTAGGLA